MILPSASIADQTPREGRFSWLTLILALGLLAYLGAWLSPSHYPPWLSFHGESLTFVALVMVSLAWASRARKWVLDRVALLPMALIGLIWLQWGVGQIAYFGEAVMSSLYLGGFTLAWLLGSNLADKSAAGDKILSWLAGLLVVAAATSVYIAALQWLDLEAGYANLIVERPQGGRPNGNLAQSNHLATLLLMGLVMSVWLYHQQHLRRWQAWVLVAWLSFGLTMAQSRAGWLSAGLLGLFLLWRGQAPWRIGGLRAVLGWWSMLLAMWLAWKPANVTLLATGESRALASLTQDNARVVLWRQILAGIEQSPWWGYGWGQTVAGHKAGTAHISSGLPTDYAHSLVLDLTLWLGIPLAILLMATMAWWLLRAVYRINDPRQLLLMAAALPVLVHSLVEFPFAYAYFLFTVAFLFGSLSIRQSAEKSSAWIIDRLPGRSIGISLVVVFAVLSARVGYEYVQVEEDYRVMRFEMRSVGRTPENYEAPDLWILNQLGAVLKLGRVKPRPGMSSEELESMKTLNRNYNWAVLQMRYAVALALNGQVEQALMEMKSLRAHYGEISYKQAKQLILEQQNKEYPQLKELKLPE